MAILDRELEPKQQRFVQEYLLSLNSSDAAVKAGYSERSAAKTGYKLLRNSLIIKAIDAGRTKTANRLEITREKVLIEIASVAFVPIRTVAEVNRMTVGDKVHSLRLLMAHLGMLESTSSDSTNALAELVEVWKHGPVKARRV